MIDRIFPKVVCDEDVETIDEARNEIERLRGLLKRCEPFMLILEDAEESKEAEFWKLIEEVKKEIR